MPQHFETNPKMNANWSCFSNLSGIRICVNIQLEHLVFKPLQTHCDAQWKVCQVALVTKSSSTPLTRTGSLLGLCSQLVKHNNPNDIWCRWNLLFKSLVQVCPFHFATGTHSRDNTIQAWAHPKPLPNLLALNPSGEIICGASSHGAFQNVVGFLDQNESGNV